MDKTLKKPAQIKMCGLKVLAEKPKWKRFYHENKIMRQKVKPISGFVILSKASKVVKKW